MRRAKQAEAAEADARAEAVLAAVRPAGRIPVPGRARRADLACRHSRRRDEHSGFGGRGRRSAWHCRRH